MAGRQVITTTVFGKAAEDLGSTFGSFAKVPDTELHVFAYGESLPRNRLPGVQYHLVDHDQAFVSVRRDALFRRWVLPDKLNADYALVVDATDAICVHPLPPFEALLRGASVAGATEWGSPVRILGQGFTSAYLNAGVTFWHLPSSRAMRQEIVERGRNHFRGPFDDQTALNEVIQTRYFDRLTILPSQYNWRAYYRTSTLTFRSHFRAWWPRIDSLDGVYIYHNQHCFARVAQDLQSAPAAERALLPELPVDHHPLSSGTLFWRRLVHRLRHI